MAMDKGFTPLHYATKRGMSIKQSHNHIHPYMFLYKNLVLNPSKQQTGTYVWYTYTSCGCNRLWILLVVPLYLIVNHTQNPVVKVIV